MIATSLDNSPSPLLKRTAKEFGELLAGFAYLQFLEMEIDPRDHQFAHGVYLELGALGYLKWLWAQAERSEIYLARLPQPSSAEANIIQRINSNPSSFASIDGAQLSRRLFEYQMNEVSLNTCLLYTSPSPRD